MENGNEREKEPNGQNGELYEDADVGGAVKAVNPMHRVSGEKRIGFRMVILFFLCALVIAAACIFVSGIIRYNQLQAEKEELQEKLKELESKNEKLNSECIFRMKRFTTRETEIDTSKRVIRQKSVTIARRDAF